MTPLKWDNQVCCFSRSEASPRLIEIFTHGMSPPQETSEPNTLESEPSHRIAGCPWNQTRGV